jgi:hypothetical protein
MTTITPRCARCRSRAGAVCVGPQDGCGRCVCVPAPHYQRLKDMQREARAQKMSTFSVSARTLQKREDKELERQMRLAGVPLPGAAGVAGAAGVSASAPAQPTSSDGGSGAGLAPPAPPPPPAPSGIAQARTAPISFGLGKKKVRSVHGCGCHVYPPSFDAALLPVGVAALHRNPYWPGALEEWETQKRSDH